MNKKTGLLLGAGIALVSVVATWVFASSTTNLETNTSHQTRHARHQSGEFMKFRTGERPQFGSGNRPEREREHGRFGSGNFTKFWTGQRPEPRGGFPGFGKTNNTWAITALESNNYDAFIEATKLTKEEFAEMVIHHKEMQKTRTERDAKIQQTTTN